MEMKSTRHVRIALVAAIAASLGLSGVLAPPVWGQSPTGASAPVAGQQTFVSADEAVAALTAAVSAGDRTALRNLFGPALDEIDSGDAVADKIAYERFAKRLKKMTNAVRRGESTVILYVGAENWPFPFPIVRSGDRWFFDIDAGLREIFNRRIGANELKVLEVCRQFVHAQREYASVDRDGDEVLEYAQRINSSPGKMDGLYWPSEDDDDSPLGALVAEASKEGYTFKEKPVPFHGYYFAILKRQGASAPGGAYNYVINGNMIGGFALVAYPAMWVNSGLMTFIVNQQGKVYEKDLGPNTSVLAARMATYNPDSSWRLSED
jgi:hypothetical protein